MPLSDLRDRAFVALIDSAPDGILLVDEEGTIVMLNEAAEQLFGFGREELLGQKVEALIPPGRRGPSRRRAWAWLVNMSKTRPGVAIA